MTPVGLVVEPVAAASYFSAVAGMGPAAAENGLVYDFGAGTLAVSVVRQIRMD